MASLATWKLVGPFAAVAILLGACGSTEQDSKTAESQSEVIPIDGSAAAPTADGGSDASGTADATAASSVDSSGYTIEEAQHMFRELVDCFRGEGVDMAPAAFDASGKIDVVAEQAYYEKQGFNEPISDADLQAENELYDSANEKCAPEDMATAFALIVPEESAYDDLYEESNKQFEEEMLAFAQCMRRSHPEYPNPVIPDFNENNETEDGTFEWDMWPGIDEGDPKYRDADIQCGAEAGFEYDDEAAPNE